MKYSYILKRHINRKNFERNSNDGGYTLIELLAIIVVLSLIIGIVIVFANGIINNAKEKSYKVTASNIENIASSYAIENDIKYEWLLNNDDNSKEYFCVSVEDLIDMGFLSIDTLDSYIGNGEKVKINDYVYVERDIMSKVITKRLLLSYHKNEYGRYCDDYRTGVNIEFTLEPIGWAKKKELTIKYKIFNLIDKLSNYTYGYDVSNVRDNYDDNIFSSKFDNLIETEVIDGVNKNGIVYASVKSGDLDVVREYKVENIDTNFPEIQLSTNGNGNDYSKSKNVTISLVDNQSGLKKGSYNIKYDWSLDDKSCDELTKNVIIDINNDTSKKVSKDVIISNETGKGKLYVCGEGVSDNVDNIRDKKVENIDLYLDNVKPIVSLGTYNGNGVVSKSVTIPLIVSDKDSGINRESFVAKDITVLVGGKKITSGVNLSYVSGDNYNLKIDSNENGNIVLKIEKDKLFDKVENGNDLIELDTGIIFKNTYKVIIQYDVNGGVIESSTTDGSTTYNWEVKNDLIYKNGVLFTQKIEDNETANLKNYNNSKYIKITKSGYGVIKGSEWICSEGCIEKNKIFDQTIAYKASDFCDVSNGDCTITLKVNWRTLSPVNSYKCRNGYHGNAPYTLLYTGDCKVINDGNGDWRVKLLTDGDLTYITDIIIDAFLVGGGGGGGAGSDVPGGGGGGSGYTTTTTVKISGNKGYNVSIGAGGEGGNKSGKNGENGSSTIAFKAIAMGGSGGIAARGNYAGNGGTGGSGGGGGGGCSRAGNGANMGNNGDKGNNGNSFGGTGQNITTCEFGVSECNSSLKYSGGGGGGAGRCKGDDEKNGGSSHWWGNGFGGIGGGADGRGTSCEGCGDSNGISDGIALDNTGGGGGGGHGVYSGFGKGGRGGSGVVVIRNSRNVDDIEFNFQYKGGYYAYVDSGNGDWEIKFLSSGTFIPKEDMIIDAFLVGGGGGGSYGKNYDGGGGGGGGYVANIKKHKLITDNEYIITIGGGGGGGNSEVSAGDGGNTIAFSVTAKGGKNGSNGNSGAEPGGKGAGSSTREFGAEKGKLYAGGGGGGSGGTKRVSASGGTGGGGAGGHGCAGSDGIINSGGGGGGGSGTGRNGGGGGSGIIIIRNKR